MKYWIWLQTALGYGSAHAVPLLKHYGSPETIYRLSSEERRASHLFSPAVLSRMETASLSDADSILEECSRDGITLIPYGDSRYPYCLSVIDAPPLLLYVKGTLPDFDGLPTLCLVGPRKVSDYGKKACYSLAYRMAKAGFIIVSGGALGTDTCAHLGALRAGGQTALVMGCGIHAGYLKKNLPLRNQVAESGCLISEYPPQYGASRFTFPVRNRIMAGLCCGTVVIEAGEKSGALVTANHANDQGRDVFVIPGSPADPAYAGSNQLLRDGARPLLNASDIFEEYLPRFPDKIDVKRAFEKPERPIQITEKPVLNEEKTTKNQENSKYLNETLSKNAKILYNHLDKHSFYPDDLVNIGLNSAALFSALTELEFEGLVHALPGGMYERTDR